MEGSTPGTAGETPSTFLKLCTICHKPFTKEYSFSRHVSYCRRAKTQRKNRPRSCRRCYTSKTKCNLARPQCSRCQAQGLECIYEGHPQQLSTGYPSIAEQQKSNLTTVLPQSESFVFGTLFSDSTTTLHNKSSSFSADVQQGTDEWIASSSVSQLTTYSNNTNIWQSALDFNCFPVHQDDVIQSRLSTLSANTYQINTSSKFAASLLSHAISAFPQMMLRRQTFPPFIHAHWHLPSLPETLANCMSIAQTFATRTSETRPFLWRMIGAEVQRVQDESETATLLGLQHGLQAVVLFVIMAIADQDAGSLSWAPKLIQAFKILCNRSRDILGGSCFSYSGDNFPVNTWEDWIYAETRRRIICVWFVISRIISVQPGGSSIPEYPMRLLPLVSNKTLWEARSLVEWETEKALYDTSYPMTTFDELIEAKRCSSQPLYRRKLETWDAGVDKMGVLMNIATELV